MARRPFSTPTPTRSVYRNSTSAASAGVRGCLLTKAARRHRQGATMIDDDGGHDSSSRSPPGLSAEGMTALSVAGFGRSPGEQTLPTMRRPAAGLGGTVESSEGGAMAGSVYKVIDIIGTSETSWEDAAKTAVEEAAGHLEDLRVAEVVSSTCTSSRTRSSPTRQGERLFKYRRGRLTGGRGGGRWCGATAAGRQPPRRSSLRPRGPVNRRSPSSPGRCPPRPGT